jgi:hypothetical protein
MTTAAQSLKIAWSQVQGEQDGLINKSLPDTNGGLGLLRGPVKPAELSEMLATIPVKPTADRLVARFFDPHSPTVLPFVFSPIQNLGSLSRD